MKRILIDSVDKRLTVSLVSFLKGQGYEVHALQMMDTSPLSAVHKLHYITKNKMRENLVKIFSEFTYKDLALFGNPEIISYVNEFKPNIRHLTPMTEIIEFCNDKRKLLELAKELDILTPEEAPKGYPKIVKLNKSEGVTLKAKDRYRIVEDDSQLKSAYEHFSLYKNNIIEQQLVEGTPIGVSLLLDQSSNLIDYIVHQRILEYPKTGGPSVLCVSIVNDELVKKAYNLLKELKWKGLAMVEFKGLYLMEINPRFWGSMPLIFISASSFFKSYLKTLECEDKTEKSLKTSTNINKLSNTNKSANANENVNIKTKMKKNLNTNTNTNTNINTSIEIKCNYNIGKRMYYFPQILLVMKDCLYRKDIKKLFKIIGWIITSKEGVFRLTNPMPMFRYLKTLIRRGSN